MKFLGMPILILCIYLCQISSSMERSDEDIIKRVKLIRDSIYGVGEQLMNDFKVILEEYRNNSMVFDGLSEGLFHFTKQVLEKEKEDVIIDVKAMKDQYSTSGYIRSANALEIALKIDNLKIYQSILSKQLPPERYNGIINLFYVGLNKNSTTEEIESALGYLYGTDAAATKISSLYKFPDLKKLAATDCAQEYHTDLVSSAEYTLRSMIHIKPKALQDFTAIRDKFPCHYENVLVYLRTFVNLLKLHQGADSKVDACKMKANPGNWEKPWQWHHNSRDYMERELQELESKLSTRLTDATYGGIIKFLRASIPDTTIDEIEKALEYLYDDVPKAKCAE